MKTKFKEENKRVNATNRSGSGSSDIYVSKWEYYESLLFLKDTIEPRISSGNFSFLFQNKINEGVREKPVTAVQKTDKNYHSKQSLTEVNTEEVMNEQKAMDSKVVVNQNDYKNEIFLRCLLPWLKKIPKERILTYRMKFLELTLKYEEKNDDGKELVLAFFYNDIKFAYNIIAYTLFRAL